MKKAGGLRFWWAFICFFFWPRKFLEYATQDSIAREFETNEQLQQRYPGRDLSDEEIARVRRGRETQTQTLRRSILSSLVKVVILCLAAGVAAALLGEIPGKRTLAIRVLPAPLILWAVWGRRGWDIQSFSGRTLPERVNDTWFRCAYGLGVFLLILATLLPIRG